MNIISLATAGLLLVLPAPPTPPGQPGPPSIGIQYYEVPFGLTTGLDPVNNTLTFTTSQESYHYNAIAGQYSMILGEGVTCREDYAICLGLGTTMAIGLRDGTWIVDWAEVLRISQLNAVVSAHRSPTAPAVIAIANLLLIAQETLAKHNLSIGKGAQKQ